MARGKATTTGANVVPVRLHMLRTTEGNDKSEKQKLWARKFLIGRGFTMCCTYPMLFLYQPRSENMKTFIQDMIGVIAIFGTLYAGLIIGHGIGL